VEVPNSAPHAHITYEHHKHITSPMNTTQTSLHLRNTTHTHTHKKKHHLWRQHRQHITYALD